MLCYSLDAQIPGYHRISYCVCRNLTGTGGHFGNKCILIGRGAVNATISRTIVEHSVFNNTGGGDSEVISVKCQQNLIRYVYLQFSFLVTNIFTIFSRYCTFSSDQIGMLSFRNGDWNVAYGNFFIGAGGVRVKQVLKYQLAIISVFI